MHQLHGDRAYAYRYTPVTITISLLSRVFIGLFNANMASAIINCRSSRLGKVVHIIRTELRVS